MKRGGRKTKARADDTITQEEISSKLSKGEKDNEANEAIKKDILEIEKVVKSSDVVNSTLNVPNENNQMEVDLEDDQQLEEDDAVFIEAETVGSAVDVIRDLLSSVSDQMSPIPAPRANLRNVENYSSTVNSFKPSQAEVEPKLDQDFSGEEDTAIINNSPNSEKLITCIDKSRNDVASLYMKNSLTQSEEKTSIVHEEHKNAEKTDSVDKSAEKAIIEKSRNKRVTRSKVSVSGPISELEAPAPRRLTKTKGKAVDTAESLNDDGNLGSARASRIKTKSGDSETESSAAVGPLSVKRVTRSKVSKVALDEENPEAQRCTRTFSKKNASTTSLTKSAASPRVRELAARVLSPARVGTPPRATCNLGYTGSPIRDRVRAFEDAMKESAGLKSSSDEEIVSQPKTLGTQYFTPKRKSSIANSLRKVSAARKMTVSQVVQEQEVNVVSPPKRGPVIRKSPAKTKVNLNNSRAPAGKVVKAGKKVLASGGRGITPGSGSSTGSNSLMKSRSRMNIIEKAGRTTPIEKGGRTTPQGHGPANLKTGVSSFLPPKQKGPTLEEIQDKKEEERKMKEQREVEARVRREEQMKQKADELKRQREERMKRVKEAREKNEDQKEKELSKRREEKETQEKLAVLKKKEERHKESERKRKEAEMKENKERLQKEEEERQKREENERRQVQLRVEEEGRKERIRQEQQRKEEEQRRMEEKRAYAAKEKERILREQDEMRKLNSQNSVPTSDLNSTYNKPGDATFNKTQTLDQSIVSIMQFYNMKKYIHLDD